MSIRRKKKLNIKCRIGTEKISRNKWNAIGGESKPRKLKKENKMSDFNVNFMRG